MMTSPDPVAGGVEQLSMPDAFRKAFRRHPAGVAVITAAGEEQPVAMTVSSLASVSADPPLVTFSLSNRSGASRALCDAGSIVIHLLQYDDLDLAKLGAASGVDRFGPDITWETLPSGEPRYSSVRTWFRARILDRVTLEGATLVVAQLTEGHAHGAGEPDLDALVYCDQRWHRLGDMRDVANG